MKNKSQTPPINKEANKNLQLEDETFLRKFPMLKKVSGKPQNSFVL